MCGYIKIFRQLKNWEWYKSPHHVMFFIHCLLSANFEDKNWRGINIKRGCFVSSFAHLSAETGLSVQNIRTCVNHLKSTQELTHEKIDFGSIFQVVNYDKYQMPTQELTNDQQAINKRSTHTKEIKKERINICSDFEKIWSRYPSPRRQGKKEALKHFNATVKTEDDIKNINKALDNYLSQLNPKDKEYQYTQKGSTWFNNWQDWVGYLGRSNKPEVKLNF